MSATRPKHKITKEAEVLKYMRISKSITTRTAGEKLNCSHSAISHYEQCRMRIPKQKIEQLVAAYGYTMEDFGDYLRGKPLPLLNLKTECMNLLHRLDENKLRAVHAVLVSFVS